MTLKEMKSIKDILNARFEEQFEKVVVEGQECFVTNDGRVICVGLIPSNKAVVIEYADNVEEAKLNRFEDGDLFYLTEADTDTIFQAMLREIAS